MFQSHICARTWGTVTPSPDRILDNVLVQVGTGILHDSPTHICTYIHGYTV